MSEQSRIEKDSLGEVSVPASALYGAQSQRAVENFPISGVRFPRPFIRALALVKRSCARANVELGIVAADLGEAIVQAATEVADGEHDEHFPLDVFQTGSGTSTNMNANEVISNRAIQLMGGDLGSKTPVHPNDHVNQGQSSNDVIPTTIHVSGAIALHEQLLPSLTRLAVALRSKAVEFDGVVKTGRTHLQDATPVRLGQEFAGYATQVEYGVRRVKAARDALLALPLGGTAVGTGLNRPLDFPARAIAYLAADTGLPFVEAEDHFEAQGARDAVVEAHGHLKTVAASLTKIANDIRWLACGPRTGFAEINLPAVQPGSSIMPGKVNPVMNEALIMVCASVMGHDVTVGVAGAGGNFELNVMMPVMAHCLLSSTSWLSGAVDTFTERCVSGITVNAEVCEETVERGLAICTALAPAIGYDKAAAISKEAFKTGRTVREVGLDWAVLPADELDALLDARAMTEPGVPGR
ncbi:MAG: aspartate ammonia-lyase [Rickettsiales bacterium]|nr:aspartate ammonia-lyase [Rickettsiales bacterium]|tara:strand:+ start:626 stop:2032 length:1407 start_codon:yes stop_codon:yes gene_type:complete